jgi:hypothetical protein
MLDAADAAAWKSGISLGTLIGDFRYWQKSGIHHAIFSSDNDTNMEVVHKAAGGENTFKQAAEKYDKSKGGIKLIINASFGDNSRLSLDAWNQQVVMGDVIEYKRKTISYTPTPDRAFLSFQNLRTPIVFTVGLGSPLMSADAAVSGLCPLIIGGKKFDKGNDFYNTLLARSKSTGKVVFGQTSDRQQYVGVQPNGVGSLTVDDARDRMAAAGMVDAVLLDGSDSAMLYLDGQWKVSQGSYKDKVTKIGLAFF